MKGYVPGILVALIIVAVGFYYESTKDPLFVEDLDGDGQISEVGIAYKDPGIYKLQHQGIHEYEAGDFESAEKTFLQVIEEAPDYPAPYLMMGNLSIGKKEYSTAIRYYEQALVIQSDLAQAYAGLAMVHTYKEDRREAIKFYNKALQLVPNHSYSHFNIAEQYFYLGDYVSARKHYQSILKLVQGTWYEKESRKRLEEISIKEQSKMGEDEHPFHPDTN